MKKIKTLLPTHSIFYWEIKEKIDFLLLKLEIEETLENLNFIDDALYEILSLVGDVRISLQMLEVALKLKRGGYGVVDKWAIDLVINYYCINKLGFFKEDLEEMLK